MKNILADLRFFGKQYLRSKTGAFFAFVFPILLILLFGALFTNVGSASMTLPTQDLDGTPMSRSFLGALNNTTFVHVTMIPSDVDLAAYIKEHSLTAALLIPANFQDDVMASVAANSTARVNITLYGDVANSNFGVAQGVVAAVAQQMNFEISRTRPVVALQTESVGAPGFQYLDFFLPGIVGMTVMTNAMYWMTGICAEYRTRRYFKLLATTTLTKAQWLASKILLYFILMVLSLFATVAVGAAVWNIRVTIDVLVVAFIGAGVVLFTSLGMLLGTVIKDPESGTALANAVGFPMMFLSGSFWSLDSMPTYLQTVARALPLTYLNDGLRDAMVFGNVDGALFNLAVVTGLGIVFFALGARLMSWKER